MAHESQLFAAIYAGDMAQLAELLAETPMLAGTHSNHNVSAALTALYYGQPELGEMLAQTAKSQGILPDVFTAAALNWVDRLTDLLTADPALANAAAGDGFQPLGLAAFFGQEAAAAALIAHGAVVNAPSRNPMRVMPLHSAVAGRHLGVARRLVQAGADVNVTQADGFAPLHGAAQNGQPEMIQLLLEAGADRNARTAGGKTPLDFARESGNLEAVQLLAA